MTAGAAEMAKGSPDGFAGISAAVIAHNDNEIAFQNAGNDAPRNVMDFQKEFGNDHQNIGRRDLIEMDEEAVPDDMFALDGLMKKLEILKGKIGNLDFSQYVMVRQGKR